MKLLRLISLLILLSTGHNTYPMLGTAGFMAASYILNKTDRTVGYIFDKALFIYNMGQFYQVLKAKPKFKPCKNKVDLAGNKKTYMVDVNDYIYLQDGHLFKSNGEALVVTENAYRIQDGLIYNFNGEIIDAKTFINKNNIGQYKVLGKSQLSTLNKSFFDFKFTIRPSQNRQFVCREIEQSSKAFGKNISQLEHDILQMITEKPEIGIHGKIDGLHAHLSDYSKLSLIEQRKYNTFTKHLNQINKLIYDESGKFKGTQNINTFELAQVYADYLAEMYSEGYARIKIEQLANQNIIEFQRIHNHIDGFFSKTAGSVKGFVKQFGRSIWNFSKDMCNIIEVPNLDTEFLNKIKNNVSNQNLAKVHNLYNQCNYLEAVSIGDQAGVFKEYPMLKRKIISSFKKALNVRSVSPVTNNIIQKLIEGKSFNEIYQTLSKLSVDHSNPVICDAYKDFFNEYGVFRLLKYNPKALQGVQVPKSIGNAKFILRRELLNKYLALSFSKGADIKSIKQAIKYICASMGKTEYAQAYFKLAHGALEGGCHQLLSDIGDLTTQYANNIQQTAQNSIVHVAADIFDVLSKITVDMSDKKHNSLVKALIKCGEANHLNINGYSDQANRYFLNEVVFPLCNMPEFKYLKKSLPKGSYTASLNKKAKQQLKKQMYQSLAQKSDNIKSLLQRYNQNNPQQIVFNKERNENIIYDRRNALLNSVDNISTWQEKTYMIKPEAQSLLSANNIDTVAFEYCYGDEIHQQLHDEFVTILNEASQLESNQTIEPLLDMITTMSATGSMYAQEGKIDTATQIADFCWTTLDCGKAACEGIVETVVHKATHPKEIVYNLAACLENAGTCLGKLLNKFAEDIKIGISHPIDTLNKIQDRYILPLEDPDKAMNMLLTRYKNTEAVIDALSHKYQEYRKTHALRDVVKNVSSKTTDIYLDGKLLGALLKTAGAVKPTLLKGMKRAEKGLNTSRLANSSRGIKARMWDRGVESFRKGVKNLTKKNPEIVTPEGFKVKVLPKNINFMGKAKNVGGKAGKASSRSNQFHNKMRGKPKGPSYKVEKASKSKSLKKTPLKEHQKMASVKVEGYGIFKNKNIKMRYKHFLEPEVRIIRTGKPNSSGWHHDPNGMFESKKLFNGKRMEILSKKSKSNGVYKLEWRFEGGLAKESTFFPKSWSRETVLNKVKEAFNYCKKHKIMPKFQVKSGNYVLEGFAKQGIKVRMIIRDNVLITAYPIID